MKQSLLAFSLALTASLLVEACAVINPTPGPSPTPIPTIPVASPSPPGNVSQPSQGPWPLHGWLKEYDQIISAGYDRMPNFGGMDKLCPKWGTFTDAERRRVWGLFWKSITMCESNFTRCSSFTEDMGIDPVTGQKVRSQGLLQLSYQDTRNYKSEWCAKIDWQKDKNLPVNREDLTIYDPVINLNCAMDIAAANFAKFPNGHPEWGSPLGRYWSCARPGKRGIKYFLEAVPECRQ